MPNTNVLKVLDIEEKHNIAPAICKFLAIITQVDSTGLKYLAATFTKFYVCLYLYFFDIVPNTITNFTTEYQL